MPAAESLPDKNESLHDKLAAIDRLIEQAERLIQAQEQVVDRMRASGLDCRHAQGLLEAFQASSRIAIQEKRELEAQLAHRSSR